MLNYKRAQIGETISWVVATIIIIGILIISIYISTLMAKVKNIEIGDLKTDLEKESIVLSMKNSLSYNLSSDKNKEIINNALKENE